MIIDRPNWQIAAACRGTDPSLFFRDEDETGKWADYSTAKAVCRLCPVTADCLAYAFENNEKDGVWGGMTPSERRKHLSRVLRERRIGQQSLIG